MSRRKLLLVLALIAVASAAALFVVRRRNPPRAVDLLPQADGVLYVDVELLRTAGVFDRNHPIQRDPDFEDFVRQTGFDFERDLDDAAFALHNPQKFGRGDDYPRFSEIFIGRFDVGRCTAYLRKLAAGTDAYRGATVFNIPHEDRTVRVALLDEHTAASSNTESPDAIRQMIDAWHDNRPEHSLAREFYREVPRRSIAWFVARVAPPPGAAQPQQDAGLMAPSWLRDIAAGSTIVAWVRFVTRLEVRAVAHGTSDADAARIAQNASSWLAVFRTLQQGMPASATDADVKSAFDSIAVEQQGRNVNFHADIPAGALRKITAEAPGEAPKEKAKPNK